MTTIRVSAPTRRSAPIRLSAAKFALLTALGLSLLAPSRSAHAEIVDYDPATEPVPTILDTQEMECIGSIMNSRFVYMETEPNPAGTRVFAFHGTGEGFIDLTSGEVTELDGAAPGNLIGGPHWQDDNTLVQINREEVKDSKGVVTGVNHHRVTMNATTGKVEYTAQMLPDIKGTVVGFSPDLKQLLVLEVPSGAPPVKKVTLGQRFDDPKHPGLPDKLPGRVGQVPQVKLEVQQVPAHLVQLSIDGLTRHDLMSLPAGSAIAQVNFSPDGRRLAVAVMTMPSWDGDRKRDNDPPPAGLPDLGSINVREALGLVKPEDDPVLTGAQIDVFDTADGAKLKTFNGRDYPQGMLYQLAFSRSGNRAVLVILARSDLDGRPNPTYAYPSAVEYQVLDGQLNLLRRISRPDLASLSGAMGFLDDAKLFFAVPNETDTDLVTYDLASDQTKVVWHRPGSIVQVVAVNGKLVFSQMNVDRPIELWKGTAANMARTARPVTALNNMTTNMSMLQTATITWKGSDGQTMSGLYVYPDGWPFPPKEPGPVVVWQQGGPGGQVTNDFGTGVEAPYSILPNLGIPVFMANFAGRSVRSPQFFSDLAEGTNFGQLDIRQMKEGVEALVGQKIADPKRVGITGCSYGGYFTMQSLRTYPDLYAAANTQCTLVDLFEEFNFGYTPFISYLMGRAPQADPTEYMKDSPLYGTREVKTPTLIFHGTDDFLPLPLINNMHDQLVANGTPVRFLRVKGEHHGFSDPKSQMTAVQEQVRFFREQLHVAKFVFPKMNHIYMPVMYDGEKMGD